MEKLKLLDLFSGIGGMSLGLERSGGFETVAFCEIEEFPRKVLNKHWPEVPIYDDVRTLTAERLAADGITVNAICGGFPCQDISVAGKRGGIADGTRSGLWSEFARLIGELRPQFVLVENVANLLSGPSEKRGGWFGRVLGDLAECGYDAEWENIPAAAVGAPHRRQRVWIIAYPASLFGNGGRKHWQPCERQVSESRDSGSASTVANANSQGLEGRASSRNISGFGPGGVKLFERCFDLQGSAWQPEPNVGRVANGVSNRVDRLKGLGNAVVPQIPELIGRAWMEANHARGV